MMRFLKPSQNWKNINWYLWLQRQGHTVDVSFNFSRYFQGNDNAGKQESHFGFNSEYTPAIEFSAYKESCVVG